MRLPRILHRTIGFLLLWQMLLVVVLLLVGPQAVSAVQKSGGLLHLLSHDPASVRCQSDRFASRLGHCLALGHTRIPTQLPRESRLTGSKLLPQENGRRFDTQRQPSDDPDRAFQAEADQSLQTLFLLTRRLRL